MIRITTPARRALVPLLALGLVVAACGGDDDDEAAADGTTAPSSADSAAPSGDDTTGGSAPAEDLGSIKVGLVCGGMTPLVAQIAMNTDAFSAAGVEVDKLCFDGGSEGVQALIGGSVDIFLGSFEHVASTREQGLDTRAYGVINNVFPYWALTKSDSSFESVADLAGEVVGVTSPGSLSETGLRAAVADAGISFDDLQVIGAGSGATMRSALDAGQIAAGMVSEPGISELTLSGDYRILWEPPFPYISIVVLASEGWASDHAAALTAFLDVLEETAERATTDTAWAVEAMSEEGFEVDQAALEAAVERTLQGVPEGLAVTEEDVASTSQILVDVGRLDAPITLDEGFDFSYLES
jgi:NitT/TauT family transport system substrate-binding protein